MDGGGGGSDGVHARGRWPGLFGSLVDGVVQGHRARYTKELKKISRGAESIMSKESNFLLNTTDLDNQYSLLHPVAALTYCPG